MRFELMKKSILLYSFFISMPVFAFDGSLPTYQAGHSSLQKYLLPDIVSSPESNKLTPERAALGKKLFWDPRLSGTGQSTCGWCHTPERGWSDGLRTGARLGGEIMKVATPTIVNIGYNKTFMWDGRAPNLEKQGFGGQKRASDINAKSTVEPEVVIARLNKIKGYVDAFAEAYPEEGLTRVTVGKAIASFERTIVSNNSPFDQWVKGDKQAMTKQQINGFKLFNDPSKANCVVCHNPPNFTDDGFHNIGLKEYGEANHNKGRGSKRSNVGLLDGAFKTPTLRDVELTAPYMHDGSLNTLRDVVAHYVRGGDVKTNLSPSMSKQLILSEDEVNEIVAFLRSLTTKHEVFTYPILPKK